MSRIWSERASSPAGSTSSWRPSTGGPRSARSRPRTSPRSAPARSRATPERVAEIELTTDHDTAAFVDAVAEQLGPEGRWLHYGLTSSDVVDTALALQIQDGGRAPPRRDRPSHRRRRAAAPRSIAARSASAGPTASTPSRPPSAGSSPAGPSSSIVTGRASPVRSSRIASASSPGTVGTYAGLDPEVERSPASASGSSPTLSRPR